jgi:hypothetical protein
MCALSWTRILEFHIVTHRRKPKPSYQSAKVKPAKPAKLAKVAKEAPKRKTK